MPIHIATIVRTTVMITLLLAIACNNCVCFFTIHFPVSQRSLLMGILLASIAWLSIFILILRCIHSTIHGRLRDLQISLGELTISFISLSLPFSLSLSLSISLLLQINKMSLWRNIWQSGWRTRPASVVSRRNQVRAPWNDCKMWWSHNAGATNSFCRDKLAER